MLSNIDLNPATGANDIVHVFILFRLKTHAGSNQYFRNGLFGHDNGGWDKFVCFNPRTSNSMSFPERQIRRALKSLGVIGKAKQMPQS